MWIILSKSPWEIEKTEKFQGKRIEINTSLGFHGLRIGMPSKASKIMDNLRVPNYPRINFLNKFEMLPVKLSCVWTEIGWNKFGKEIVSIIRNKEIPCRIISVKGFVVYKDEYQRVLARKGTCDICGKTLTGIINRSDSFHHTCPECGIFKYADWEKVNLSNTIYSILGE
jgi:hypothetical protein